MCLDYTELLMDFCLHIILDHWNGMCLDYTELLMDFCLHIILQTHGLPTACVWF